MFVVSKLQVSDPAILRNPILHHGFVGFNASLLRRYTFRPPLRRLAPPALLSVHVSAASSPPLDSAPPGTSELSSPSRLTESVGPPPLHFSQWTLTHKHIVLLNVIACATAVSATWLFFAAIPALLAFRKAAESLTKLMDVTREELPDTMAAIRLSGMEISDLTMELSDLGHDITQGVRNSTRAVRLAEERLRRLTNMDPVSMQEAEYPNTEQKTGPRVARAARNLREGIVKGRSLLKLIFTITRISKMAFSFLTKRSKQQ
ncbi:PREDICTED: uncharacterized protein LOC104818479 isoform X2 [Tarenaya hassleriana]|uniref:uncharacterized protein LOC104818479 isoform X2 n=1 Tax=Tarenaya hassleriana TaxID=28532 RepID=UPI00053C96E4|nr:PREDICTED: uncharacterized protein LOC104818479 isoform X2 [Tarenaya hassleriana]